MSNVECIIPLPGDKNASVALSALIHALAETESAAIVRFVKREKAAPHLGVLLPRKWIHYMIFIKNILLV